MQKQKTTLQNKNHQTNEEGEARISNRIRFFTLTIVFHPKPEKVNIYITKFNIKLSKLPY